jgi:hypothetical protein
LDFHEVRVRPTHYTITTRKLQSWVVESSLDGEAWTEIDRKTGNQDFRAEDWATVSYGLWNPAECRFIRLTQTGQKHVPVPVAFVPEPGKPHFNRDRCPRSLTPLDDMAIRAFEVFGTLTERRE